MNVLRPIVRTLTLALFVAAAPLLHAQPLADRVPANAAFYLGWAGADALAEPYAKSRLKAVMEGAQIQKLLSDHLPQLAAVAEDPEFHDTFNKLAAVATPTWRRPFAMFLGGKAAAEPGKHPTALLAMMWDMPDDAAATALAEKLATVAADAKTTEPIRTFARGTIAVISLGYEDESALVDKGGKALSADEAFTTTVRQVGPLDAVVAYVSGSRSLELVDGLIRSDASANDMQEWAAVRQSLGLDGLRRGAFSVGFDGANWATRMFIDAPAPRTGLAAMFDGKPIDDAMLNLVPRTATWLSASRFDLQRIMDLVRAVAKAGDKDSEASLDRSLAEAKKASGVDIEKELIAPLGDAWVLYSDPAVMGMGGLGICAVHLLDDPATFEAALAKFQKLANDEFARQAHQGGMRMAIQSFDMGGMKVHSLMVSMLSPSWSVHEGKLYLAIFPQAIQTAAMYAKGDQPTILKNEKFTAMRRQLAAEHATSLSFSDLPLTAPATYQSYVMLTQMIGAVIAQQTGAPPMIMLPPLGQIMPHLTPAGSASWADATGYRYMETSPFPGASLLSPQGGMSMTNVSTASMAVGVLLPALGAARKTAKQMQSLTQARGVQKGMILFAQGNDAKLPDDIAALIEGEFIAPEYALSPTSSKSLPADFRTWPQPKKNDWIRRNASYILLPGLKDDSDSRKISLFGRPEHHPNGPIPVAYNDNHAVTEHVEDVKAKLVAQTGKTMEELIARQESLASPSPATP